MDGHSHSETALSGKRVLVVEDEPIVAVDYHFQLMELGATPVGYKSTNQAALDFLSANTIDAAIVDYRLRDRTSEPVMIWLREHAVPFVIISANVLELPEDTGAAGVLDKPVLPKQLAGALSRCFSASEHF